MRRSILQTVVLLVTAGVLAVASATLTADSSAKPPDAAGLLKQRAVPAVRPERTLLLAITRVGQRLVSVGEHGTIGLSDDNGDTWRSAAVPVDVTLTAVKFANTKTGWAVGHMGVVLRTDDGGENWQKQFDGSAIAALADGDAQSTLQNPDDQLRKLADEGPDKPLLDLLVEDDQRVTVVGAFNLALTTKDGGKTWAMLSGRIENSSQMHLYGIASVGEGVFAVGEQSLLLKRVGERYVAIKSPYEGSFFGIARAGDRLLVVFGLRGNVFQSFDGGGSWRRSKLPGTGASINGALRLAHGRLILFDQAGGVFASVDGGSNFQRVPFDWGAPLTGMVEAADGNLIATSVVGITRIPKSALAQPFLEAGMSGPGGQR